MTDLEGILRISSEFSGIEIMFLVLVWWLDF